jgi:O-methyltransferase
MITQNIRTLIHTLGYDVRKHRRYPDGYETVYPSATYAPWRSDASFRRIYQAIKSHSLVDEYRCFELWTLVRETAKVEGALIEVGVWRGGTGALIAERARLCGIDSPVYLCDTFHGVVKASTHDSSYRGGEHADTSRRTVEKLLAGLNVSNATILEGIFPDDTAALIAENRFRFCHIDVDVYRSARDIADWIWDRMPVGGIVVYDDFGFRGCPGIRTHIEEQIDRPDRVIFQNLNGHAVVVKTKAIGM